VKKDEKIRKTRKPDPKKKVLLPKTKGPLERGVAWGEGKKRTRQ